MDKIYFHKIPSIFFIKQAENRSGLSTDLTPDVFDESETEDVMDAENLLSRAVQISNSRNVSGDSRHAINSISLRVKL